MPRVLLRFTAANEHVNTLLHALESIEGIEHVEEVADLMPHMDDEDSSSAGLSDALGPTVHDIEVEAPNEEGVLRVHHVAETIAMQVEGIVEFVDEF